MSEREREREREEKGRRTDYRWEYRMTLSSKNFRLANDQVRSGMKSNQLFQIGSGVTGIESFELLKMELAESRSFSLYVFFPSSILCFLMINFYKISRRLCSISRFNEHFLFIVGNCNQRIRIFLEIFNIFSSVSIENFINFI